MSGFSPDWLALREPVDHRSRDAATAARLTEHFAGRQTVSVVDLGCGAGSNIRATYRLLPSAQAWTLVDPGQGPTEQYDGDWLTDVRRVGAEHYYAPLELEPRD